MQPPKPQASLFNGASMVNLFSDLVRCPKIAAHRYPKERFSLLDSQDLEYSPKYF